MSNIKIGLASINTQVGDIAGNSDKIIKVARKFSEQHCHIGVFQASVICGFPCKSLDTFELFHQRQLEKVSEIVRISGELEYPTIFFLGISLAIFVDKKACPATLVIQDGKILGIVLNNKDNLLSSEREIVEFGGDIVPLAMNNMYFQFPFGCVASTSIYPPSKKEYDTAPDIEIIQLGNQSVFRELNKSRLRLIYEKSLMSSDVVCFTNQVGGQDSLVFDGGACVFQNGKMVFGHNRFEEGYVIGTVNIQKKNIPIKDSYSCKSSRVSLMTTENVEEIRVPAVKNFSDYEETIEFLCLGFLSYFEKSHAFKKVGLALSGGADSVLTLLLLVESFKRKFSDAYYNFDAAEIRAAIADSIQYFGFPTQYNSEATKSIAEIICRELKIPYTVIPIQKDYEDACARQVIMLEGKEPSDIARQNIQARIRAFHMMNWSNSAGGMVILTGNFSEGCMGYATVGGDLLGNFNMIADLPKTYIFRLLDYFRETIYEGHLKALELLKSVRPSAELGDDQDDEVDLMPYYVIDLIASCFLEEKMSPSEILEALRNNPLVEPKDNLVYYLKKWFRLFFQNRFKSKIVPIGLNMGTLRGKQEFSVISSLSWLDLDNL